MSSVCVLVVLSVQCPHSQWLLGRPSAGGGVPRGPWLDLLWHRQLLEDPWACCYRSVGLVHILYSHFLSLLYSFLLLFLFAPPLSLSLLLPLFFPFHFCLHVHCS
ncbi:hypothetical protein CHARACLAT_015414 [Characodon lateralis]|uniref:Secreted protein n=1 Tax=Characodon lateralis TaxID=208331 RepID=A0ABU7EB95_9TELE|nr:hypothetical protein [Characodon lateralis]